MKNSIHVLLSVENYFYKNGIERAIEEAFNVDVLFNSADNSDEVESLTREQNIDLILTCSFAREKAIVEAIRRLRIEGNNTPALFVSNCANEYEIISAYRLGYIGFIHHNSGQEELIKAVQTILDGGDYYGHEAAAFLVKGLNIGTRVHEHGKVELTKREREVLILSSREFNTTEIAYKLNISVRTVEGYRQKIKSKLSAKTWIGVIQSAQRKGLLN